MTLTTSDTVPNPLLSANWYNDSIKRSKLRPLPKLLFGEFWLEGELAILFAGSGRGKSVLATQIAESIAGGKPIKPFKMTAEPQRVGLVDLVMSDKQLEMRYSAEPGEKANYLHKHHRFAGNMLRITLDAAAGLARGKRLVDDILAEIEQTVREYELRVLILDNITFLRRSSHGTREMLAMILGLNRLKHDLGLSILVLSDTPRQEQTRPLSIGDLQSGRVICGVADSVFAIGQSRADAGEKYIKHIFSRSTELICDASHVPVFTLKKIGGNFLGFDFDGYAPERELLWDIREHREWQNIEKIKEMTDGGMNIRDVAEKLDLSKTKAHRLLQMWRPPKADLTAETPRRRGEEAVEDTGPEWNEISPEDRRDQYLGRLGQNQAVPDKLPSWIGGVPRPRGGVVDPTRSGINTEPKPEHDDDPPHSTTPACGHPSYPGGELETSIIDTPFRHTAVRPDVLDNFTGTNGTSGTTGTNDPDAEFVDVEIQYDPDDPAADQPRPRFVRLHKTLNEYDKEIFVEKYSEWGQREVWYQVNRQGITSRSVRKNGGIHAAYVVAIGSQVKWKPPGQPGQAGQEGQPEQHL